MRAAKVAGDYDGAGCDHDYYSQLGDSAKTKTDIAAAIRKLKEPTDAT